MKSCAVLPIVHLLCRNTKSTSHTEFAKLYLKRDLTRAMHNVLKWIEFRQYRRLPILKIVLEGCAVLSLLQLFSFLYKTYRCMVSIAYAKKVGKNKVI